MISAGNAESAFEDYILQLIARLNALDKPHNRHGLPAPQALERLIWGDGIRVDLVPDLTTSRKDRPIRRRGWQFGDRTEYQAFFRPEA